MEFGDGFQHTWTPRFVDYEFSGATAPNVNPSTYNVLDARKDPDYLILWRSLSVRATGGFQLQQVIQTSTGSVFLSRDLLIAHISKHTSNLSQDLCNR